MFLLIGEDVSGLRSLMFVCLKVIILGYQRIDKILLFINIYLNKLSWSIIKMS